MKLKLTTLGILLIFALLCDTATAATTTDDVISFLKEDTTEQNILTDDYTSKNFANDLVENASNTGIDAYKFKVYFSRGCYLYLVAFEDGTVVNPRGTREGTGIDKIVDGNVCVGENIDIYTLTGCQKNYDLPEVKKIKWLSVPEKLQEEIQGD